MPKLNYKKTIFVGLAFFLICAFWQAYDNSIPMILVNEFGMSQTTSGIVMALDNVLALFLLPFFGTLSDRAKSPRGKRTPFIVAGTIVAALAFAILPFAKAFAVFFILLIVVLLSMSFFRSPAVALMPDVTIKPLRSKANAIINLLGAVGGIIILALGIVFKTASFGGELSRYTGYFFTTSGLMLVSLVVFLLTVKEPKLVAEMEAESKAYGATEDDENTQAVKSAKLSPAVLKSLLFLLLSIFLWFMGYNAITSKYSVYATEVLNKDFNLTLIIAQVAAIISYLPVGIIASKIGRKKTILGGIVILAIAFSAGGMMRADSPTMLMNLFFALAGIGWATINVNSFPMVVEMCSAGDVGKYTGFYYTASMSAQVLTPILSGFLMDRLGLTILFPYGALFVACAFFTMLFVRHGDSKPEAKRGLEALEDME